jgi:hypothetical protein
MVVGLSLVPTPLEVLQHAQQSYLFQAAGPNGANGRPTRLRIAVTDQTAASNIATALETVGIPRSHFQITPQGVEISETAISAFQRALDIPVNGMGQPLSVERNLVPRPGGRRPRATRADGNVITIDAVRETVQGRLRPAAGEVITLPAGEATLPGGLPNIPRGAPGPPQPTTSTAAPGANIEATYEAALTAMPPEVRARYVSDVGSHRTFMRYLSSLAPGGDNEHPRLLEQMRSMPAGRRQEATAQLLAALEGVSPTNTVEIANIVSRVTAANTPQGGSFAATSGTGPVVNPQPSGASGQNSTTSNTMAAQQPSTPGRASLPPGFQARIVGAPPVSWSNVPRTSNERAMELFQQMYESLPPEGRRWIDHAGRNPNLRIVISDSETINHFFPKERGVIHAFSSSTGPQMICVAAGPGSLRPGPHLVHEAVHNVMRNMYSNTHSAPWTGDRVHTADPRRALFMEALRLDLRRNGGNTRAIRNDLELHGYAGSSFPSEIVARIAELQIRGQWTPDLQQRYPALDRYVREILHADFAAHAAGRPLPELNVAQYRQGNPAVTAPARAGAATSDPHGTAPTQSQPGSGTRRPRSLPAGTSLQQALHWPTAELPAPPAHFRPEYMDVPNWDNLGRRLQGELGYTAAWDIANYVRNYSARPSHVANRAAERYAEHHAPDTPEAMERFQEFMRQNGTQHETWRNLHRELLAAGYPASEGAAPSGTARAPNQPEGANRRPQHRPEDWDLLTDETPAQEPLARRNAPDTDPRRALLSEALRADLARNGRDRAQLRRDLGLEGPITGRAVLDRLERMELEGTLTPELAERYRELNRYRREILHDDMRRQQQNQPPRTIDPAEYRARGGYHAQNLQQARPFVEEIGGVRRVRIPVELLDVGHRGLPAVEAALQRMGVPRERVGADGRTVEVQGYRLLESEALRAHLRRGGDAQAHGTVIEIPEPLLRQLNPELARRLSERVTTIRELPAGRTPRPGTPGAGLLHSANTGVGIGAVGMGLIQDRNAMTVAGAGILVADGSAALLEARAQSILRGVPATTTQGAVAGNLATAATTSEAAAAPGSAAAQRALRYTRGANTLRSASALTGHSLTVVGIGMSLHGAANADEAVGRTLHLAQAGLGIAQGTAAVAAARTARAAAAARAAGNVASAGRAARIASAANLPVAVLMITGSTAIEVNDIYQGYRQHANELQASNNPGYTEQYLGNHLGTDPAKLAPHTDEYRQLNRAVNYLRNTANAQGDLSNPAVLRPLIQQEIARLEADPRSQESHSSFWSMFTSDRSSVADQAARWRAALEELDTGYEPRHQAWTRFRASDPDRAGRLQAFIDRSRALDQARAEGTLTPQTVQQDIIRGLGDTRAEFRRLLEMRPEARDAYLRANSEFLSRAGVAPISPLANSLLTYENLLSRAEALGMSWDTLTRIGLGPEARRAEVALLEGPGLAAARRADPRYARDRQGMIEMLRRRRSATSEQRAAIDAIFEAQGGYERIAQYYDLDLATDGLGLSNAATLAEIRRRQEQDLIDAQFEIDREQFIDRLERLQERQELGPNGLQQLSAIARIELADPEDLVSLQPGRVIRPADLDANGNLRPEVAARRDQELLERQQRLERDAARFGIDLHDYGLTYLRDRPEAQQQFREMLAGVNLRVSERHTHPLQQRPNEPRRYHVTIDFSRMDPSGPTRQQMEAALQRMGIRYTRDGNPLMPTLTIAREDIAAYLPQSAYLSQAIGVTAQPPADTLAEALRAEGLRLRRAGLLSGGTPGTTQGGAGASPSIQLTGSSPEGTPLPELESGTNPNPPVQGRPRVPAPGTRR